MSERAKDRVSGASERESGRVNKRVDVAVMNDSVLARGIRQKKKKKEKKKRRRRRKKEDEKRR